MNTEGGPQVENNFSHSGCVRSVSFSPSQSSICSTSAACEVILWDLVTATKISEFHGHDNVVYGVDFSPSGKEFATCSKDSTVRLWNTEGSLNSTEMGFRHLGDVNSVQFTLDGGRLVSASDDKTIKILNVELSKLLSTLEEKNPEKSSGMVFCLDLSSDNRTLVSAHGDENLVKYWDFRSEKCVREFKNHTNWVYSAKIHCDSNIIATGCWDHTIALIDIRKFEAFHIFNSHKGYVNSVSFHPSGEYLISGSDDGKIGVFNIMKRRSLFSMDCKENPGLKGYVVHVQFSPDGKYFASGHEQCESGGGEAVLWKSNLGGNFSIFSKLDEEERKLFVIENIFKEESLGRVSINFCADQNEAWFVSKIFLLV